MAAGTELTVVVRYAGHPRPLVRKQHGDAGWEELTDGVIVAGQPHGSPTWFPCNDRPDDKASYRIAVTTDPGYLVVAQRQAGRAPPARQQRDLGATSRSSRWRRTSRPSRSGGTPTGSRPATPDTGVPLRIVAPADLDPAAFRRGLPAPARDGRRVLAAVRALPVRRLHRRGHGRRPRDPAGVAEPLDVRPQPGPRRLGRRPADRARARPPVVRQRGDPGAAGATSGCTRASPATASGCGRRSPATGPPTSTRAATGSGCPASTRTCCSPTPARS